jgi:hypothetical protein
MNKKTLLVAIGAAVFGFASSALAAGQGGIAGAASFLLPGGAVSNAAAAVAVGKSTGYANANTMNLGVAQAQAAGAAGVLSLDTATAYITSIAAEDVATLPTPQANAITATSTNIDAINTTVDQVQ